MVSEAGPESSEARLAPRVRTLTSGGPSKCFLPFRHWPACSSANLLPSLHKNLERTASSPPPSSPHPTSPPPPSLPRHVHNLQSIRNRRSVDHGRSALWSRYLVGIGFLGHRLIPRLLQSPQRHRSGWYHRRCVFYRDLSVLLTERTLMTPLYHSHAWRCILRREYRGPC